MFVVKTIMKFSVNTTQFALVVNESRRRLLYNSLPLFSKIYSPDSSPIKVVSKKKRKISSSSEEDEPSIKKEVSPVAKKK